MKGSPVSLLIYDSFSGCAETVAATKSGTLFIMAVTTVIQVHHTSSFGETQIFGEKKYIA